MTGMIFDIQRSCIHDGPGIRTVVFLKGCDLRCAWCHNPESFSDLPQLSYAAHMCVFCGSCGSVCTVRAHRVSGGAHSVDFDSCVACGRCAGACLSGALKIIGRMASAREIMEEVLKDSRYYEASGGGVTFSGGEPMLQPEFLGEMLAIANEHSIHTAVETNGLFSQDTAAGLLEKIDLFLFDVKLFDDEEYRKYTCSSNRRVHENLDFLYARGKPVILRCPIIPGINDTDAHYRAIAGLLREYPNILSFEVLPYHNLGMSKRREIGYEVAPSWLSGMKSADKERKAEWEACITAYIHGD